MDEVVSETLKDSFKPETSNLKRFFKRFPTFRKVLFYISFPSIVLNILFGFGLKSGTITWNSGSFQAGNTLGVNISNFGIGNSSQVTYQPADVIRECHIESCMFKDSLWIKGKEFIVEEENPLTLYVPGSKQKPGAIMYYDKEVKSYTLKFSVIPMASPSANLVVTFGTLYRCVIGDGGYKEIGCQINQSYPTKPEKWKYFNTGGVLVSGVFHQYSPWKQNEETTLKVDHKDVIDDKVISIQVNGQPQIEWKVPREYSRRSKQEKVGVGLINPKLSDDVRAVFKTVEFEVKYL